jgi:hypothetical protein
VPGPLAWGATAATATVLALAVLAVLRAARRRRHRRAGARGAWSEVLDLLVLMGRPAPAARTATDVAADLVEVLGSTARRPRAGGAADPPFGGPHPALLVAQAAERVAFAPGAPPARQDRRAPGGAAAWSAVRALRRAVRAATPLHRRLLWTVDPRPLRRRRR